MIKSTRNKGNKAVRRCIEHFENKGYIIDKVEKTGKFTKIKDLFGLFDVIAMTPDEVIFIQVTAAKNPHTHKNYLKFSHKYSGSVIKIQQYVWKCRKGFDVYKYYKNNNKKKESLY